MENHFVFNRYRKKWELINKELKYFLLKNVTKLSEVWLGDPGYPRSGKMSPGSGSKCQKAPEPGSRISNFNEVGYQHKINLLSANIVTNNNK